MGCGASKKTAYEAPLASGPSWILRQNGISIDDALEQIRTELKIKADLAADDLLGVARQQRGLADVEGNLREKVYNVAVEYGIWTGWDTDVVDVWVGSIPAAQATKGKLKALFERYGHVINVTVRYKPRSALNPDNNKSWAVLTFSDKADSSRALRAETFVKDDEGQRHRLKVKPQDVERNRALRANEDNGPGKMENMIKQQQQEVEKRRSGKGGKKKGARASDKDAGAGKRDTGKVSVADKRKKKAQELRQALNEKGLDTSGGVQDLEARLKTATEVEGMNGGGGTGITGGFTFAHNCTLWVGKIPIDFFECPTDVAERRFKQLFEEFGKILSVSTRKKPNAEDDFKSWGLVTFADKKDAKKVLRAEILVPPPDGGGDRTYEAQLVTKVAKVNEELAKPSTGSLAVMWKSQEKRIAAAKKIQAAVRARKAKQKGNSSQRNDRKRHPGLVPR
jgi:RNA recognition motif-containing protein